MGLSFSEIERSRIEDLFLSSKFLIYFPNLGNFGKPGIHSCIGAGGLDAKFPRAPASTPHPPDSTDHCVCTCGTRRVSWIGAETPFYNFFNNILMWVPSAFIKNIQVLYRYPVPGTVYMCMCVHTGMSRMELHTCIQVI
jgi:hypothetical protein